MNSQHQNEENEFILALSSSPENISNTKKLLYAPEVHPSSAEDPSPYNLFSKDPTSPVDLSPRHFSLVSTQSGMRSCEDSEDETFILKQQNLNELLQIRAKMKHFFHNFNKKQKKINSDFESLYNDKAYIYNKLNDLGENSLFKSLRKAVRIGLRINDATSPNFNKRNSYILNILEINLEEMNKRKKNFRKSSKL